MSIKIKCNRAVVDPETNDRRPCGHIFKVDSSLAGKVLRCPRCKQGIEIPQPGKPKDARPKKRPRPAAPVENLAPLAGKETKNSLGQSSRDYQKVTVCQKCGKPVTGQTCNACGFKEIRRNDKNIRNIKPKPVGMQRWLIATINQALPARYLAIMIHIGLAIIVALICFATITAMSREALSAFAGISILGIGFLPCVAYLALVFKSYQFLLQPGAQLAWFQRPFWNWILRLARKQNWKDYDSRLSSREVITVSDEDFDDQDLLELDRFRYANVLDLEGTKITDNGLEALYGMKQLQCLVLRNTLVSKTEVYRFQQTFPKVWIWQ